MLVKTLHIYLIKKYIPPFLATLFIGMFIFLMIFTFTYIDEIAGKGVEGLTLAQMFGYIFLNFLPPSMPLAVLLSSIMTFGNLGETYELASMKSAGQSLLNIMKPLLVLIFGLATFCFFYNNYTMTYINLQAGKLLYSVRAAKPAFNLKEGVFYNGIDGYTIKVGQKDKDGIGIHNIYIYDQSEGRGNTAQTYAKDGEITMSKNMQFLTFKLKDGTSYQQPLNEPRQQLTRPNMIMHFKEQTVRIDLSSLKMQENGEGLLAGKAEVMDLVQLRAYKDTAEKYRLQAYVQTYDQFVKHYFFLKSMQMAEKNKKDSSVFPLRKYLASLPELKKKTVRESAVNMVKSAQNFVDGKMHEESDQVIRSAEFDVEWHNKFTVSFACIILFFVGAPLGAIVRKGGFGMPVVISVFLFIIYHVVTITFKKMVIEGGFNVVVGMWLPQLIFLPIGLWLSVKAANDSPLFEGVSYIKLFSKLFPFKRSKPDHAHPSTNQ